MEIVEQELKSESEAHYIIALIPAYNEERNIKSTILKLPDFIEKIVVVNDGSSDGTENMIFSVKDILGNKLTYLKHDQNQGKGEAILKGFNWIQKHFNHLTQSTAIILIDGDGQMDLKYIKSMTSPIFKGIADFVKATRFRDRRHFENMPKFRYYGNQVLKILNWIASGHWNISDPQNGYFALSLEALNSLNLRRIDGGYFFENSILIETGKLGHHIIEVSVPGIYGVGEDSTINYAKYIPTTSFKLFINWILRIIHSRNNNKSRKLVFFTFLLFSIFFSIQVVELSGKYIVKLHFYSGMISIIFLLLLFIFDFIDYKNKFDPSVIFSE